MFLQDRVDPVCYTAGMQQPVILPYQGVLPTIAPDAYVAPTAAVIGQVTVGRRSSLWFGVTVRGDVNVITIGAGTNVQDGTVIHVNHDRSGDGGLPTHIGDGVTIGHLALIHACTLEDGAFVGMKACVMDRAVVKHNGMVAAGALVTPGKVVGDGELWAGSPARLVRRLTDAEIEANQYIGRHYCDVAATYRTAPAVTAAG